MTTTTALTDGMWMEHPDSIERRARQAAARNLGATEAIAARTTEQIRVLIEAVRGQGGTTASDLNVMLHAELVRRAREAA